MLEDRLSTAQDVESMEGERQSGWSTNGTERGRRLEVLSISNVYPNPEMPTEGLFVRARLRAIARRAGLRVVAPVPWINLHYKNGDLFNQRIPYHEHDQGLEVLHPHWFTVPRYAKELDGYFMYRALRQPVRQWLTERPVDLIDAHWAYPTGFAAVLLGQEFGLPVSITLRGTLSLLRRQPTKRPLLRYTLKRAACLIAVADFLADDARELGASAERTFVVPNGVDPEIFHPRPIAELRARLDLPADVKVVVSVGHITRRRGFHRLARAVKAIGRKDLVLVIVGGPGLEGNDSLELENEIDRLDLRAQVRLTGNQPPAVVADYLGASDVFCLASSFEGWPNVLLEALACGTPVVASRVGANAQILAQYGEGEIFDLDDPRGLEEALVRVLDTPFDRAKIARRAQRRSWDHVAEEVLAAFEKSLQSLKSTPGRS